MFVEGQNSELWHIEHDDGDEEDLEEYQLHEGIADYRKQMSSANISLEEITGYNSNSTKRNSLNLPLGGKVAVSQKHQFYRPRLVLEGPHGMGQGHVARAILHALEEIPIFTLSLSDLIAEAKGGESIDIVCLRHIVEAKRSAPCILYIPAIDVLWSSIGIQMRRLIITALEDVDQNLPLFILAWCSDGGIEDIQDNDLETLFPPLLKDSSSSSSNNNNDEDIETQNGSKYKLSNPSDENREQFFDQIFENITNKMEHDKKALIRARSADNDITKKRKREALEIIPPREEIEEPEAEKDQRDDEHCIRELRIFLRSVMKELWKERKFQPFFHAVDEEVVTDYYKIIKNPMDLDQVSENIDDGVYTSIELFLKDLKLIVTNAKKYNKPTAGTNSLRGRQIISSANQMFDTVNSFIHRFRKRLGYDLLERCAKITKKLKSKRRKRNYTNGYYRSGGGSSSSNNNNNNNNSYNSPSRSPNRHGNSNTNKNNNHDANNEVVVIEVEEKPMSREERAKAREELKKQAEASNSKNMETVKPTLTREERYRLRNGLEPTTTAKKVVVVEEETVEEQEAEVGETGSSSASNGKSSNQDDATETIQVEEEDTTQNNNFNDTISPNQNVEGADDDESQVYTEEELKRKAVVLSKLKTIKSKYVLKTKEYNIEKLEELHATVTRTMQSYYKSALSLEILLDILEAHANGL